MKRLLSPSLKNVRLVTTPTASQLTGLSTGTLREWTSRRALIPADVRPATNGSPARYCWQTILVLRVAARLREGFGLELEAHRESFAKLRRLLGRRSFRKLWGRRLALSASGAWSIVDQHSLWPQTDAVFLDLDPHLEVLQPAFVLPSGGTTVTQQERMRSSGPLPAARVEPRVDSDGEQERRSA